MKRALPSFGVAAFLIASTAAHAQDVDRAEQLRACEVASERGQLARRDGKLVDASTELLACARDTCPAVIRNDCEKWAREVTESIPTIVVVVRLASGLDVQDATISLDDREIQNAGAGRAVPVDPGPHVLSAKRGELVTEQRFIVHEGEKLRAFTLTLGGVVQPPPPPPPQAPPPQQRTSTSPPYLAYAMLGLGVVDLGISAAFAIKAKSDYDKLESTCAPYCDRGSARDIDDLRVGAVVLAGLGAALVATGLYFAFFRSAPPPSTTAQSLKLAF